MNVIAKISCYLERSVVTLKLCKEYLITVTYNTQSKNPASQCSSLCCAGAACQRCMDQRATPTAVIDSQAQMTDTQNLHTIVYSKTYNVLLGS